MICSMTAFARQEQHGDWGSAVWEIRSINHRYLDIALRLPEELTELEVNVRELLRSRLQRGKLDCTLHYQPSAKTSAGISVNVSLVQQLLQAATTIQETVKSPLNPLSSMEILRWPGVVVTEKATVSEIQESLLNLLDKAIAELITARAREGAELQRVIEARTEDMLVEIQKAKARLPEVLKRQHERILERLVEAQAQLEPTRLEQEMVFYAQKIDVAEEIDRLQTHVQEVTRLLKQGGAVGRRLDFLLQELNREANTLGAKSVDKETTAVAIQLKVLIEQIREQIQNLE